LGFLYFLKKKKEKKKRQDSWCFGDDFLVCQGMNKRIFKHRRGRLRYTSNDPPQQISFLVLDFRDFFVSYT